MTEHDSLPAFTVTTPLAGTPAARWTTTDATPGVRIRERHPGRALRIAAWRGATGEVRAALTRVLGIEPPAVPAIVTASDLRVVWSGPGQWLVLAAGAGSGQRLVAARSVIEGIAAAVEQSSARMLVEVTGPMSRRALGKVLLIDLHPSAFPAGAAAMTDVAHVAGMVWRLADRDGHAVFEIATPRSSARSVWHALVEAAGEFGVEAVPL